MVDRPLRIALLTHSVNPRGGVVHTLELGEALQRGGHAVTVMAPAHAGERFFRSLSCRVELAELDPMPAGASLVQTVRARIDAYVSHLARRLRTAPFDVCHAQDSISGNALAILTERSLITGFVRTVHHLDDFDDAQLAAWQRRAFTAASTTLCVSRLWQATLQRRHGIAAVRVQNGVDLQRYSAVPSPRDAQVATRLGLRPGAPLVLAVGGVEERKNTLRLFEAFMRLRATHPSAQLLVAGGATVLDHGAYARGFADALAASGITTGAGAAVVVCGTVDDAEMPSLYRLADVLAMPSLREGFGLAVLEALASGTPAVVSKIAPFTEHLTDADVAWADPRDATSIAAALAEAIARPRFSEPPSVCRRFDWAASARRHAALYRETIRSEGHAAFIARQRDPAPTETS